MPSQEHEWFLKHPEIETEYSGEYVAIVGEAVVAHGKDFKAVLSEAEEHGDRPLIHKVPPADREMVV